MAAPTRIVEMSRAELAVRLCEANYGLQRPEGLTAEDALEALELGVRAAWIRSADAAAAYFEECSARATPVS